MHAQMIVTMLLLEGVMHGGPSAALVVLVHPVVMNQQVRLQELQSRADLERGAEVADSAGRPIRCRGDDWPEPLAPTHRQVADLGDQLDCLRRKPRCFLALRLEKPFQDAVDVLADAPHPRLDIHLPLRHGVSVLIPSYVHGRTLPSKQRDDLRH